MNIRQAGSIFFGVFLSDQLEFDDTPKSDVITNISGKARMEKEY
jgi:hypothetical protein